MLSKNLIKEIRLLHQLKYRRLNEKFIVEGPKIVEEFMKSAFELDVLIHTEAYEVLKNVKSIACSKGDLERVSLQKNPNQVLAVFHSKNTSIKPDFSKGIYLALDGIRDPGNLGTIIRTAEWFGIHHIICSTDTVEPFNPKVIQSSMGASARVQLHYTDLAEFLTSNKGVNSYSTLMEGDNLYRMGLPNDAIIFIGNEANGMRPETQALISNNIHIPRAEGSLTESLNASIACSVILSEFKRRGL